MTEEKGDGGLYIDSDWKAEAAKEKERLAAEEAKQQEQAAAGGGAAGEASFLDLVNMMAMQAIVALGGGQGPGGEQYPANPAAAKHVIDLLGVIDEKTKGNLSDEEKRVLDGVLYELRMQFVHITGGGGAAPQTPPPPAGDA